MKERIDLKAIERKVYTSYHQDGLIDIFAGFSILSFGLVAWIMSDMIWMGFMFFIVSTSLYAAAKRIFTVPRIGFVKLPPQRAKRTVAMLVGVGVLSSILGMVAFMQTESGGTPLWLLLAIENYMLVIGASVAALFCVVGYTFRTKRMYAHALLALVMFVAGHFLYFPLYYYLVLLGTLILLVGLTLLIRFVRRYPLSGADTMGDRGNEGR
jgi:hypothetical protein